MSCGQLLLSLQLQQVMRIQPTGSVEQLYSPSYGSRASSSLSLNSSGNRSDLNANFHSSLPVVYSSSQERLGLKGSGRRVPRPKWSSHDRLLSPLLCTDIESLASKGKKMLEGTTHTQYHTHLYTPKRTRKTGAPTTTVSVERSSSFHSTGFYRTSSDGGNPALPRPPVTVTNLTLDDMPALPPQTTRDAISTSPDVSGDIESPLPAGGERELTSLDPCELPLQANDDSTPSSGSTATDATFDYNDLSPSVQNGKRPSIHGDEEFDFTLPETPPPPSPPISSLPAEDHTPPTSPSLDEIASCEEEAPPTPLTSPPHNEPSDELSTAGLSADSAQMESQLERHITPRTALAKAFEELDKIGVSKLPSDGEEMGSLEEDNENGGDEGDGGVDASAQGGMVDVDHLYAKVDMSKKRRRQESSEVRDQNDTVREGRGESENGAGFDHLYAKVDMSKKRVKQESSKDKERDESVKDTESGGEDPLYAKVDSTNNSRAEPLKSREKEEEQTFKQELVHKAASVEDIVGPDYAEVQHPKRSSMPASDSPAQSPTHSEPGYATIKALPLPPIEASEPHPPDELHPPPGKLYEVTPNDTIGRKNQRSINKLGVMLGPEFKHLSGLHTLNKPLSIKVSHSYLWPPLPILFIIGST